MQIVDTIHHFYFHVTLHRKNLAEANDFDRKKADKGKKNSFSHSETNRRKQQHKTNATRKRK